MLDEYKDRLTNIVNDARDRLAEIKPLIDGVTNVRQHQFLVMQYITGFSTDEIASKECYSHYHVLSIICSGIKNINM